MNDDLLKFKSICNDLIKSGMPLKQIAFKVGLSVPSFTLIIKGHSDNTNLRSSTLAKMQDFNKKHAMNDLHFKSNETTTPDPVDGKAMTFGEHLDNALHLCPPTYKFSITLERIP
jgi:hypothetical protein